MCNIVYKMKIGIIGAGIFGGTIAIKLAENGFDIDLFEKEKDIDDYRDGCKGRSCW